MLSDGTCSVKARLGFSHRPELPCSRIPNGKIIGEAS
jgi:hypothetical protein